MFGLSKVGVTLGIWGDLPEKKCLKMTNSVLSLLPSRILSLWQLLDDVWLTEVEEHS